MNKPSKYGITLLICAVTFLSGCVVQERVYRPLPAPRVYRPPVSVTPVMDVEIQATEAPPPLPDYEQPPCPEDGFLWTPGYWHWNVGEYFWIPGTWVRPPRFGVLWTPGYWAFNGGIYGWHGGYWGPHVGFYGGVNYGFGYVGVGFVGGRWAGNTFAYNTSINNVNTTIIHNTYNQTVVNNVTVNKVSYNGGASGVVAAPTAQETSVAREAHVAPTAMQQQHVAQAVRNPALSARSNGGSPPIAATPRPGAFNAPGVVGAHGTNPGNASTQARPSAQPMGQPQAQAQGQAQGQAQAHPGRPATAVGPARGGNRAVKRVKKPRTANPQGEAAHR